MKKILFGVALFNAFIAHANVINCASSKTNTTYEANLDEGSLKVTDLNTKHEYRVEPLEVRIEVLETYPVHKLIQLVYPDRGDAVFEISEFKGRLTGSFDTDTNLKCEYK